MPEKPTSSRLQNIHLNPLCRKRQETITAPSQTVQHRSRSIEPHDRSGHGERKFAIEDKDRATCKRSSCQGPATPAGNLFSSASPCSLKVKPQRFLLILQDFRRTRSRMPPRDPERLLPEDGLGARRDAGCRNAGSISYGPRASVLPVGYGGMARETYHEHSCAWQSDRKALRYERTKISSP